MTKTHSIRVHNRIVSSFLNGDHYATSAASVGVGMWTQRVVKGDLPLSQLSPTWHVGEYAAIAITYGLVASVARMPRVACGRRRRRMCSDGEGCGLSTCAVSRCWSQVASARGHSDAHETCAASQQMTRQFEIAVVCPFDCAAEDLRKKCCGQQGCALYTKGGLARINIGR